MEFKITTKPGEISAVVFPGVVITNGIELTAFEARRVAHMLKDAADAATELEGLVLEREAGSRNTSKHFHTLDLKAERACDIAGIERVAVGQVMTTGNKFSTRL